MFVIVGIGPDGTIVVLGAQAHRPYMSGERAEQAMEQAVRDYPDIDFTICPLQGGPRQGARRN